MLSFRARVDLGAMLMKGYPLLKRRGKISLSNHALHKHSLSIVFTIVI